MVRLEDMGEKEVVSRIISKLGSEVAVGPGDDAAAIEFDDGYLVVSTDLITVGSHSPRGMTARQMGWMAAAVNLSDIAAMGARPLGMLMAMALPRNLEVERVMEMLEGARECCHQAGTSIIGGDTKEGDEIVLTGTALGFVEREGLLRRSGARTGDILGVTGPMGLPAAGLLSIEWGMEMPSGRKALMEPTPMVREGRALSISGGVTSCIDISDGLAHSIHLLSQAGGVGFQVDWHSIPVGEGVTDVAKKTEKDLEDLILYFGGEYELLFTMDPGAVDSIREKIPCITPIGIVTEDRENIIRKDGEIFPLRNEGWEHFG